VLAGYAVWLFYVGPAWHVRAVRTVAPLRGGHFQERAVALLGTSGFILLVCGLNGWLPDDRDGAYSILLPLAAVSGITVDAWSVRRLRQALAASGRTLGQRRVRELQRSINQSVWGIAVTCALLAGLFLSSVVDGTADTTFELIAAAIAASVIAGAPALAVWIDVRGVAFRGLPVGDARLETHHPPPAA